MPNKTFTARLNQAIETMLVDASLRAFAPESRSLYSPVYRSGKYAWAKVMVSDGVLLAHRPVHNDEGAKTSSKTELLVGVVLQSEDATSQTKSNPLGKAAIAHIRYGIWVTVKGSRRRIDRLVVAFVLPKGASAKDKKSFATARRNVLNASEMMPDAVSVEVARGVSASKLAGVLTRQLRPVLVGRGRPRGAA